MSLGDIVSKYDKFSVEPTIVDGNGTKLKLYHGSDSVISKPVFGFGKEDNDYGSGFYLTPYYERAAEWAISNGHGNGIVNIYELPVTGLVMIDLDRFGPLAWIAEVVKHRRPGQLVIPEFWDMLVELYSIDLKNADIIKGYRADDTYIDVITAFLNAELCVDEVRKLFYKGDLGEQYCLKSEKAFNTIVFSGTAKVSDKDYATGALDTARTEVINFLNNRRRALLKHELQVPELNILSAVAEKYVYDQKYSIYSKE